MSKIKEIRDRLTKKPAEYSALRFDISKRIFVWVAALYFLAYLFTVGGFYFGPVTMNVLSSTQYHLYSLLIIATAWFLYSLVEYMSGAEKWWHLLVIAVIVIILAILPLATHLWLM